MAFPDALREGYEVYPVVDVIGGTSEDAHRTGIARVVQAGPQPLTLGVSLAVELQRDWAREETVGSRPGSRGNWVGRSLRVDLLVDEEVRPGGEHSPE